MIDSLVQPPGGPGAGSGHFLGWGQGRSPEWLRHSWAVCEERVHPDHFCLCRLSGAPSALALGPTQIPLHPAAPTSTLHSLALSCQQEVACPSPRGSGGCLKSSQCLGTGLKEPTSTAEFQRSLTLPSWKPCPAFVV